MTQSLFAYSLGNAQADHIVGCGFPPAGAAAATYDCCAGRLIGDPTLPVVSGSETLQLINISSVNRSGASPLVAAGWEAQSAPEFTAWHTETIWPHRTGSLTLDPVTSHTLAWNTFLQWSYGETWHRYLDIAPTASEISALATLGAALSDPPEDHATFMRRIFARSKTAIAKAVEIFQTWNGEWLSVDVLDDASDALPNAYGLKILRAKFQRRVQTLRNGKARMRLRTRATRPQWTETGSAATIAKRMNPLGAPPLNA